MRDSGEAVDEDPQNQILSATLKLQFNKLIPLALNDLLGKLADFLPVDSLSHTNKKVGRNAHSETRTDQSIGVA